MFSNPLIESIKKIAEEHPSKVAIIESDTSKKITFKEIVNKSFIYGQNLIDNGFEVGDRVMLLSPFDIELTCFVLGCSLVGVVPVIADPAMGRDVLLNRMNFVNPKAILVPKIIINFLNLRIYPFVRKIIGFELPDLHKLNKNLFISPSDFASEKTNLNYELKKSDTNREFLIVFTSGTTSMPKAVVHSVDSITALIDRVSKLMPKNTDIVYADQPYIAFPSLNMGVTSVISTKSESSESDKFFEILKQHKIEAFFTNTYRVNLLIRYCEKNSLKIPNSVKNIYIGSAPVTRTIIKRIKGVIEPGTIVHDVYGMTEVLPVTTSTMDQKLSFPESRGNYLGKVREGIKVKIAEDGELLLSGNIFKHYLGEEQQEWLGTGDIVSLDKEGLFMKSRKKDMIINDAFNIYPHLYEPIIEKIDFVKESAMVGVYDNKKENELVYLFVASDSENTNNLKNNLYELLKEGEYSIDKYAVPFEIIFLNELPVKGRSGKTDKAKLRELAKLHYQKNYEK